MNIKIFEAISRISDVIGPMDPPQHVLAFLETMKEDLVTYPGEPDKWIMWRPSCSRLPEQARWDLLLCTLKDFFTVQQVTSDSIEMTRDREQYRKALRDSFSFLVTHRSIRRFNDRLHNYLEAVAFGETSFDDTHVIESAEGTIILPNGSYWKLVHTVFDALTSPSNA